MREVVAVGRAHGVNLDENFANDRLAFIDRLPDVMTSSMHNDLQDGKRLELEGLSSSVVTLGEAVGVPTPLNRAVRDILELYAQGKEFRDPHRFYFRRTPRLRDEVRHS